GGVGERARVDLIDHGAAPPLGSGCGVLFQLSQLSHADEPTANAYTPGAGRTMFTGASPRSIRSICVRMSFAMRGFMAVDAPPTCGLMSRFGALHSGCPGGRGSCS